MNRVSWFAIVILLLIAGSTWFTVERERARAAAMAERAALLADQSARQQGEAEAQRARAVDAAAKAGAAGEKNGNTPLIHTVIFYLKKDAGPAECSAMIADCHKLLTNIPSVRHMWVGKPTEKAAEPVVIKDYQFALSIHCDDAAGLQQYLEHPQHKEFVAKHGKHIEKVLVYDFVNEPAK